VEAIICSMTPAERQDPSIINGQRRKRIAAGSGTTTSQVNAVLKQFKAVQQMMKTLSRPGKKGKKMRGLAMPDLGDLGGFPELPGPS